MQPNRSSREEYVRKVLDAYRKTPGTTGNVRRPDHYWPPNYIGRRPTEGGRKRHGSCRSASPVAARHAPPLVTVRSLAYFQPVIEEVQELKVSDDYFQHLRRRLQSFFSA